MACHGMGPGCTIMGTDNVLWGYVDGVCGDRRYGVFSVSVIVASSWMVRRRKWRSVGSVQVWVGSVIEWRRIVWSPGVILSQRSVLFWIVHSRGRFRNLCLNSISRI